MTPINFQTGLLPHQSAGVEKLRRVKVGALYMEQGTGKTRTALELIKLRQDKGKINCVLWLCPCSVKRSILEEVLYHCGSKPDDFVIRGIESISSSDRLYLMLSNLVRTHKVYLVIDESNLVKNGDALRTQRITALAASCTYKLLLNGTPVSKNEADLFAQWYILDWRILGYKSYYSFERNHIEYWTIHLPSGRDIEDKRRIRQILKVDYLAEKMSPYIYSVKKSECVKLPPRHYRTVEVEISEEHRRLYACTKERFLDNVDDMRNETIYKLFTALQHVISGREVISKPDERMQTAPLFTWDTNPRIAALRGIVEDMTEKCIIFAKYQVEIDEIGSMLDSINKNWTLFTGKVSLKDRRLNRDAFRDRVQFMLANKTCGAYGLNLQFCNNIIYYSNDFDLATRLQSEDRVYRIGQTREVTVVDLYTPDTIDEMIIDSLTKKTAIVEAFKNEVAKWKGRVAWGKSRTRKIKK